MGYEVMDVSGDAGIRARAGSLGGLFTYAALGMYGLMTATRDVKASKRVDVSVTNESIEGLLVSWLNELIFLFDAHGFVGSEIKFEKINEGEAAAVVIGEDFDPDRHERGLLLKAATYHGLRVERNGEGWVCEVIFDV